LNNGRQQQADLLEGTYSIVSNTVASLGGYTIDKAMSRSESTGQAAGVFSNQKKTSVQVRMVVIDCGDSISVDDR
jgi:hypothetical protein